MVNLVKTIETFSQNLSDVKIMKTLKKQLKASGPEKNKLKQSSLYCRIMLAPIHAAILSESPEVVKLILGSKNIELDNVCSFREENLLASIGR